MNKWWFPAVTALALLSGCATEQRGNIPVVDNGAAVSNAERVRANGGFRMTTSQVRVQPQAQAIPEDSGVVVMVPGQAGASRAQPAQGYPAASSAPIGSSVSSAPITSSVQPITSTVTSSAPVNNPGAPVWTPGGTQGNTVSAPSGIPSAGGLSADEQLDGPVLALLTTAQKQQAGGDLNGASSSLERAQRIAPGEPQVLYRLAQVRLAQGDGAQAEQLARRGLSYANGRPALQASLWGLIAQARDKQGDSAGAAQARQRAKVAS